MRAKLIFLQIFRNSLMPPKKIMHGPVIFHIKRLKSLNHFCEVKMRISKNKNLRIFLQDNVIQKLPFTGPRF